mmetsp:Transcript_9395/g.24126  ORF Transcript_9395/g.24126 Transcript_9395/m.24126 type:complete len:220 (-) Transcript_9395:667-1326(-)
MIIGDINELVIHRSQKAQPSIKLPRRVVGFHGCANKGNVLAICGDVVGVGRAEHVDIGAPADLLLRYHDLHGVGIHCSRNGVAHDADGTSHTTHYLSLSRKIGRVSHDKLALSGLSVALHPAGATLLVVHHLAVWLVQHVSASIHRTKPGKTLRQFSETVEWVDVRRFCACESVERIVVQLHLLHCRESRLVEVRVVTVQCQRVANEVNCILSQRKLVE